MLTVGRLVAIAALSGCASLSTVNARSSLEAMLETDQRYRMDIQRAGQERGFQSPEVVALFKRQAKLDEANVARLVKIVDEQGWPKKSIVGDAAASGAFLVLQHADLEQQKKYLPLLQEAADAGEANKSDVALLVDRVKMRDGAKQVYGTQVVANCQGILEFHPIEDETHVDARRAAVGLAPISDYARELNVTYVPPDGRFVHALDGRLHKLAQLRKALAAVDDGHVGSAHKAKLDASLAQEIKLLEVRRALATQLRGTALNAVLTDQ